MRNRLFLFTCTLALLISLSAIAQTRRVSVSARDVPLKVLFGQVESKTGYTLAYSNADVDLSQPVSVSAENEDVLTVLNNVLRAQNLVAEISGNHILLQKIDKGQDTKKSFLCTGTVTDEKNEPMIGVSVLETGTRNGTSTDINGRFSFPVSSANAMIELAFLGYQTVNTRVGSDLRINLAPDMSALDEVVVVGFGQQKRANLTGSVTTVKMEDIYANRPISNAADALLGAVPGLQVSSNGNAPGTRRSFAIRDSYSIGIENSDGTFGNTIAPLVLIDNVEGDFDLLNPDDIETITVLKDAASTAIYGARAAGGVILVTTKRPKSNTTFSLNYNNNFAFANAINLPVQAPLSDYLKTYLECNGDMFWTMNSPSVAKWMTYLDQYKSNPSSLNILGDGIYKDPDGGVYFLSEKDLVRNMLETSRQMTHNISMSGGTDKVRYRLSGGYVGQDGVLISQKDNFTRLNASGFISADVTSWLTQEATFSYSHSKQSLPLSSLASDRNLYTTRLASYYPEGTMPGEIDNTAADLPFDTPANQIAWSNPAFTEYDNPRIFLKSIIRLIKNLEVDLEYTFDKNSYNYSHYTGSTPFTTVQGSRTVTPTDDYLTKAKAATDYNALNLYGTYTIDLGDHNIKLMAGYNQESSHFEKLEANSYGQAVIEVPALASGTSTLTAEDSYEEFAVRSGFFRVNYSYKDKYLLEVNGRYDGSSKFPKTDRFGFFPSVSVGWNLGKEEFMAPAQKWLNSFKIRASYGAIGNQNISPYLFIPTMTINNQYDGWLSGGNKVTAISTLPMLVSSGFTWEKVSTIDVGVDFALFGNRLTGDFDWYQRNTTGMLAPGMDLPAVIGAAAPFQNTADMRTRGWEVSLRWRDQIGRFGYRIGVNLSDSKSVITKYDSNDSFLLSNFYKGMTLGEIWGYVADGFYTIDDFESTDTWVLKQGVPSLNGFNPRPGDMKFKNLLDDDLGENVIYGGDGTLDNPGDQVIIGNNRPRYLFGVNLGFNFAGFDLSVFLQGTGKRDAWISNGLTVPLSPVENDVKFVPLYTGLNNYWSPVDAFNGDYTAANPDAFYPRIYGSYGNIKSNYRVSDKFLSNAAYLRIKNITLSYSFPKQWISRLMISKLSAFVSVENLATFSSLAKGIDPETLSWDYPSYRTTSFGVNITF